MGRSGGGTARRLVIVAALPIAVAAGAYIFVIALSHAPTVTGTSAGLLTVALGCGGRMAASRLRDRANRERGFSGRSDPGVVVMLAAVTLVFTGLLVAWLVDPWH